MELDTKVDRMDEELKLLKNEMKQVLLEIQERVLNAQNPFAGSFITSAAEQKPGVQAQDPAGQPATPNVAPQAQIPEAPYVPPVSPAPTQMAAPAELANPPGPVIGSGHQISRTEEVAVGTSSSAYAQVDEELNRREADLTRREAEAREADLTRREAEGREADLIRREAEGREADLARREAERREADLARREGEGRDADLVRREAELRVRGSTRSEDAPPPATGITDAALPEIDSPSSRTVPNHDYEKVDGTAALPAEQTSARYDTEAGRGEIDDSGAELRSPNGRMDVGPEDESDLRGQRSERTLDPGATAPASVVARDQGRSKAMDLVTVAGLAQWVHQLLEREAKGYVEALLEVSEITGRLSKERKSVVLTLVRLLADDGSGKGITAKEMVVRLAQLDALLGIDPAPDTRLLPLLLQDGWEGFPSTRS